MSGEYSIDMWKKIENAKTVKDLRDALYLVCCKIQELEGYINRGKNEKRTYTK